MYEHDDYDDDDENYGEDNLDHNNYAGDNESDDDKKNDKNNKEEPTRHKLPTADDLSSGSDKMSEDECHKLIKKQFICNIPWLRMHGLLWDLPGTVDIVLSCLSSVQ
jgi:hypothetical protein